MSQERRVWALNRQIDRLQGRMIDLNQRSRRYSWLRLATFFGGVALSALFFFLGFLEFFVLTLTATFVVFTFVAYWHRQIDAALLRHRLWLQIKQSQVAKAQHDWGSLPPAVSGLSRAIELDLDLTGEFSLHRLINTAVSTDGAKRLVNWLSTTIPDPGQIMNRQGLVRELAPLSLFRDRLVLAALEANQEDRNWSSDHLIRWLRSHELPSSVFPWMILLVLLSIANLLLFILHLIKFIPPLWQITFLVYVLLFLLRSRELGEPFKDAAQIRDALERLVAVFQQLESFSYRSTPSLKKLCGPFIDEVSKPSRQLSKVRRIVNATGIRGNPFFWLILNALVPWDYIFAWALDRQKAELVDKLPLWLDTWYELEALSSLANLSYLNPHYCFPEVHEEGAQGAFPVLEARGLGHPLLKDKVKVTNSFTIDHLGTIVLISGSNMSGKSTFLRTVGINLVLAQAGGPVDAGSWRSVPVRIHTCIRISDSVTDGISYFYAEVKCLKALLDELEQDSRWPLFYFIDEIFQGTNNQERIAGSRAYVRAVAGQMGIGLLSTHDLELVKLADEIPGLINLHFRDDISDGRMIFSFKLLPGPSPTTNALKIMRQEGLPL